jgi:hypothetical protein
MLPQARTAKQIRMTVVHYPSSSALQVALALTPVLFLLSLVVSGTPLTLVLPPGLVAALGLATPRGVLIEYDGASIRQQGWRRLVCMG